MNPLTIPAIVCLVAACVTGSSMVPENTKVTSLCETDKDGKYLIQATVQGAQMSDSLPGTSIMKLSEKNEEGTCDISVLGSYENIMTFQAGTPIEGRVKLTNGVYTLIGKLKKNNSALPVKTIQGWMNKNTLMEAPSGRGYIIYDGDKELFLSVSIASQITAYKELWEITYQDDGTVTKLHRLKQY